MISDAALCEGLDHLLPDFILRQRWYGAGDRRLEGVKLVELDVLRHDEPLLAWVLAEATFATGAPSTYQLLIGLRPLAATERFLEGKGRGFLGDLDTDDGPALVYDALVDPELCLALLVHVAPDDPASLVRPLNLEQSNTSIVYDERLIMKVFRRLHDGPNPDVEVTDALARVGFEHISAPVATWSRDGRDLAVVREFLIGATDGWQLALTSLRDLYDRRLDPAQSGGDFAPEARRLGEITGELHVALAEAFGSSPGDPGAWAEAMRTHLARVPADTDRAPFDSARVAELYDRVAGFQDVGRAIRVHGDYHLGQTMRADAGWFVLDFEGEPQLPVHERRQPSSPLRDVAGMLRSFHYAARSGLAERGDEVDDELTGLAGAWEERASGAFLRGYLGAGGVDALLPTDPAARTAVLDAFVLSKAVYEVGYELANRPDWVHIPVAAVNRLVGATR